MADDLDYVPMPDYGEGARPQAVDDEHQGRVRQVDRLAVAHSRASRRPSLQPSSEVPVAATLPATPCTRPMSDRRSRRIDRRRRPARLALGRHAVLGAARTPRRATLALLAGIIVSLSSARCRRSAQFGLSFLWHSEWDPVQDKLRRPGADLRHAGHLAHRVADRRAGQFRHRAVPHRALARAGCKRPLGTAIELLAGDPSIVYGMWGLFVFAPILSSTSAAVASSVRAACHFSARCSPGRRSASACSRPASSSRS